MCDTQKYNELLSADRVKGQHAEVDLYETIKNRFGSDLVKMENRFSIYDYGSPTTLIELKNRKCCKNAFKNTMIGQNKIDYLYKQHEKHSKSCYCLFNFSDGLYYIPINNETIKTFELNQNGGRKNRFKDEMKKGGYCYIPVKHLCQV